MYSKLFDNFIFIYSHWLQLVFFANLKTKWMSRSRQMDGIVGVDNTALMPCMYGTAFDRRRTKIIKVLENRVSDEIGEDFRIRTAIYDVSDYVNLSEQRLLIISGGPGDFIGEIAERHIYLMLG